MTRRPGAGCDHLDRRGRLSSRPDGRGEGGRGPGLYPLGLAAGRDGLIRVPAGYRSDQPAPLVVLLHGAGADAHDGLAPLVGVADGAGLLLLAPESRVGTWDVIVGDYGPDVKFIERALAETFARYSVDPAHLAVGGFSEGASYALSLGLTNGDVFRHIIAFSPGFSVPADHVGTPRVFAAHGVDDRVLPIERCSRVIVPRLERYGHDVTYQEFPGGHVVPPDIAARAVDWLL